MRPVSSVLAVLMILCVPVVMWSQTLQVAPVADGTSAGLYPIPGSHLLYGENQKVVQYVQEHPEALVRSGLQKTAWIFVVGSTYTWKSYNYQTTGHYDVPSTCRAVGTHCYIFVEDAVWGSRVTQAGVDSVQHAFDSQTPANASKGIYDSDVEVFGTPPDIDGDPKIVILILDIKDSYTGSGGFVAGYFWSGNEIPGYTNGNNAEIYFVDANPLDLTQAWGVKMAMSTAAHEFQHMIHWDKDRLEQTFFNEGCSTFAESYCGYGIYNQTGYINETNHYLLDWRGVSNPKGLNDYSRTARFAQYIGDQFGAGAFKFIVASTATSIAGLNAGLAAYGADRDFAHIFPDWLVANILDDASVDPHYGYVYPDLPKAVGTAFYSANVPLTTDTVQSLAARYLSFMSGSDLRVTFTASNPNLLIKAVEIGSPSRVLDVTPGVEFHEPAFGSTYSNVHFVVINPDESSSAIYTYQSAGSSSTVELKYDYTEPTNYLGLAEGDTACVWFDGVPGARLDSIRVALRRAGTMTGGVWRFSGNQRPSPFGEPLAVPITASIGTTPPFPYPVPWPNWSTVDVHAQNIDASTPFAVGFVAVGSFSTEPRVMSVRQPYDQPFHSYVYYNEATTPNWYVLTSNTAGDSAHVFMIRAYVSTGTTDVRQTVELIPGTTRLEQCYPNPFNPSTVIAYTVGDLGTGRGGEGGRGSVLVQLSVYDILGREVAVLVNEEKAPGSYQVRFDGAGLASGVYLYRLVAGSYAESRKLVLMK